MNPWGDKADIEMFGKSVPLVHCRGDEAANDFRSIADDANISRARGWGPEGGDMSYLCIGPFLKRFMRRSYKGDSADAPWRQLLQGRDRNAVIGALVHHADFWFHPDFASRFSHRKVGWHLEIACPTKKVGWGWNGEF